MIFGSLDDFVIECTRNAQLFPDDERKHKWVFGTICVWCGGHQLGDINDPNMLNVDEGSFEDLPASLDQRTDEAVNSLSDADAFEFLNRALYLDDERSNEQVSADAKRFGKFDFLTNWGESYDRNL